MTPAGLVTGAAFSYAGIAAVFSGVRMLSKRRFLPFHEEAAGVAWTELPARTQLLLLALMRVGGLGFLASALLSLLTCAGGALGVSRTACLAAGAGVFAHWAGIFAVTSFVHRRTGAATPYLAAASAAGMALAGCLALLVS